MVCRRKAAEALVPRRPIAVQRNNRAMQPAACNVPCLVTTRFRRHSATPTPSSTESVQTTPNNRTATCYHVRRCSPAVNVHHARRPQYLVLPPIRVCRRRLCRPRGLFERLAGVGRPGGRDWAWAGRRFSAVVVAGWGLLDFVCSTPVAQTLRAVWCCKVESRVADERTRHISSTIVSRLLFSHAYVYAFWRHFIVPLRA